MGVNGPLMENNGVHRQVQELGINHSFQRYAHTCQRLPRSTCYTLPGSHPPLPYWTLVVSTAHTTDAVHLVLWPNPLHPHTGEAVSPPRRRTPRQCSHACTSSSPVATTQVPVKRTRCVRVVRKHSVGQSSYLLSDQLDPANLKPPALGRNKKKKNGNTHKHSHMLTVPQTNELQGEEKEKHKSRFLRQPFACPLTDDVTNSQSCVTGLASPVKRGGASGGDVEMDGDREAGVVHIELRYLLWNNSCHKLSVEYRTSPGKICHLQGAKH